MNYFWGYYKNILQQDSKVTIAINQYLYFPLDKVWQRMFLFQLVVRMQHRLKGDHTTDLQGNNSTQYASKGHQIEKPMFF